jgi:hypothetical protein
LILASYRFLHQKLFVTRFQKRKMPPFATIRMKSSDRRDEMVLGMARDAARVKGKAREACRKKARQSGYRQVRYQRFQCRREEVFEEESRARYRVRRERSIIIIASWLEAQAKVNAEEGKPRSEETEGAGSSEAAAVEVVPMVMASCRGSHQRGGTGSHGGRESSFIRSGGECRWRAAPCRSERTGGEERAVAHHVLLHSWLRVTCGGAGVIKEIRNMSVLTFPSHPLPRC